jgi:hypothetical protein
MKSVVNFRDEFRAEEVIDGPMVSLAKMVLIVSTFTVPNFKSNKEVSLRGVVVDLSGLRDSSPGFKTRSRPLTFVKADTNFRTLHVVGFSCTNEFYRIPSSKRR